MNWWSSTSTLQAWSGKLLIAAMVAGIATTLSGWLAGVFSNRAANLLQASNEKLQQETSEHIEVITVQAQEGISRAIAQAASAGLEAELAKKQTASVQLENSKLRLQLERTDYAISARELTTRQTASIAQEMTGVHTSIEIVPSEGDAEASFFAWTLWRAFSATGQEVTVVEIGGGRYTTSDPAGTIELIARGKSIADLPHDPVYRALAKSGLATCVGDGRDVQRSGSANYWIIVSGRSAPSATQLKKPTHHPPPVLPID